MAIPPNIEKFSLYTATIFALLYEKFPVPFDLRIHHLEKNWYLEGSQDTLAQANDSGKIAAYTAAWLRDSGFISYMGPKDSAFFNQCVLTAKGLEVMSAVPDVLTSGQTLGSFLGDIVKTGAKESAIAGVKFALSKGIQYLPFVSNFISD